MTLTIKEIEDIALLARIKLQEDEKDKFAQQLNIVREFTNRIKELDTEGVEPLTHVLPTYNVFRDDNVCPSSPREEMLSNGPLVEDGQYKVPKIM